MNGVVFDLDETLVDRRGSLDVYSRKLHRDFANSVALAPGDFTAEFHRLDKNGRVPRDEFFEVIAKALFHGVSKAQIKEHFEATAWLEPHLFDGISELLTSLRVLGFRIGVVTNGGVLSQSAKLKNTGLAELVDASVISSAFGSKKPSPEIFQHIIATLQINPRQSWFIGDDPRADIWGAKQVGFQTCWVERHTPWPEDLPRCYDARVDQTIQCLAVVAPGA